jgi:hypothetical protein
MKGNAFYGKVNEDSSFSVMGRVVVAGTLWTQSSVSAITYKVFNAASVEISNGTLSVSSVVFDTLQTDGRWGVDSVGYNFRHDNDHQVLTDAGRFRIEYEVTMLAGNKFLLDPIFVDVQEMLTR